MTTEYGIWSDQAGGFVECQFYSLEEAAHRVTEIVTADPDEDDLEVKAVCEQHEEQPADFCEECNAEDE